MSKKNASVVVVAMSALALAGPTDAALIDLPASTSPLERIEMKTPLDRIELSLRIWGPQSYSLRCAEQVDACLSEPTAERALPPVEPDRRKHSQSVPRHPELVLAPVRPIVPREEPKAGLKDTPKGKFKTASLFGAPKALAPQLERVPAGVPTLAPMAHTMFCLQYPKDCEVRKITFRGGAFKLTEQRRAELAEINAKVNRSIRPERNTLGLAGEKWVVNPRTGDCNDYAVSKRHELLARGWPSRALLLAEVVTSWGEHHLVLVVRSSDGDLVLDNMNPAIKTWSKAPYRWVRMQSPRNPKFWAKVQSANA